MKPHTLVLLLLLAFPCVLCPRVLANGDREKQDKDTLIDGLLAREAALRSGTFVFQYGTMVVKEYDKGQPWPWRQGETPHVAELTIADEEWILRWPKTPLFSMYRSDFSTVYNVTEQPGGRPTYRSLVFTGPGGICESLEKEGESNPLFCVTKGGTVPTRKWAVFLKKNRDRIEHLGEKTVNGTKTQRLQIRVLKEEFPQIVSGIHPDYLKRDAMLISFDVAPSLGHAVVRIEKTTPEGDVTDRYEAAGFSEAAPGLFFPKHHCTIGDFTRNDRGYYITQYIVSEIKNVNKPVPESAFVVSVPKGTRVRDSRPGRNNAVFHIDQDVTFSKADEFFRKAAAPR